MPRIARGKYTSGFFHIMIQGINKEYIFEKDENKERYLNLMKKYYQKYNLKIIAYCMMNNHAHFIIYSENINEISSYMHKVNELYAMYYNTKNNRVGYVFRNRYRSQYIYDREYLHKCIKYIHLNPVKAKMVKREEEYKYSSYQDFINKKGYIDNSIIKLVFLNQDYLKIFNHIGDIDVEVMDIEQDNQNLENTIKCYLKTNSITLEQIVADKDCIYDFSLKLLKRG